MSTFSDTTFELRYFDVRGLGETTRVMFHAAGVPFVDNRVPLDVTTFAKPEFDAAKAAGELDLNMGRLPILTFYGGNEIFQLGQSKCIERYVAKKIGFLGDNDEEAAEIDLICEHARDIKDKAAAVRTGKSGDELKEAMRNFILHELPSWYAKLEKCPCVREGGHLVGSRMSLADVVVHQLARDTFDDKASAEQALENCPKILAAVNAVGAKVHGYMASRPVRPF